MSLGARLIPLCNRLRWLQKIPRQTRLRSLLDPFYDDQPLPTHTQQFIPRTASFTSPAYSTTLRDPSFTTTFGSKRLVDSPAGPFHVELVFKSYCTSLKPLPLVFSSCCLQASSKLVRALGSFRPFG